MATTQERTSPKTKITKGDNGEYIEVPNVPDSDTSILADCVDLEGAGLGVDRSVYTDTFIYKRWRFKLRYVGREVLLANDAFIRHSINELGLEELADEFQDFSLAPDPEEARKQAGIALFVSGAFRVDHPELSTRADELVKERYDVVLLGTDFDGDDPAKWGGLVGWSIDGVPVSKFPFSKENVRHLDIKTKAVLYKRLLGLTREGETDAGFRQSHGL